MTLKSRHLRSWECDFVIIRLLYRDLCRWKTCPNKSWSPYELRSLARVFFTFLWSINDVETRRVFHYFPTREKKNLTKLNSHSFHRSNPDWTRDNDFSLCRVEFDVMTANVVTLCHMKRASRHAEPWTFLQLRLFVWSLSILFETLHRMRVSQRHGVWQLYFLYQSLAVDCLRTTYKPPVVKVDVIVLFSDWSRVLISKAGHALAWKWFILNETSIWLNQKGDASEASGRLVTGVKRDWPGMHNECKPVSAGVCRSMGLDGPYWSVPRMDRQPLGGQGLTVSWSVPVNSKVAVSRTRTTCLRVRTCHVPTQSALRGSLAPPHPAPPRTPFSAFPRVRKYREHSQFIYFSASSLLMLCANVHKELTDPSPVRYLNPLVMKPRFGSWGNGIYVNNVADLWMCWKI